MIMQKRAAITEIEFRLLDIFEIAKDIQCKFPLEDENFKTLRRVNNNINLMLEEIRSVRKNLNKKEVLKVSNN